LSRNVIARIDHPFFSNWPEKILTRQCAMVFCGADINTMRPAAFISQYPTLFKISATNLKPRLAAKLTAAIKSGGLAILQDAPAEAASWLIHVRNSIDIQPRRKTIHRIRITAPQFGS
jgi:hypothetical protein